MFQDCNFLNRGLRLNLLPPGRFPASKFISHQFSRRGELSPRPPPHLTLWCSIHFRYFEGFRELPCLVSAWPPTDELFGEIYNCEIGALSCTLGWNRFAVMSYTFCMCWRWYTVYTYIYIFIFNRLSYLIWYIKYIYIYNSFLHNIFIRYIIFIIYS